VASAVLRAQQVACAPEPQWTRRRSFTATTATDLNKDGAVGDENGDGNVDEADRALAPANDLIQRAHAHGLLVHLWTFRNEPRRLAADYGASPINEYLQFYELGVDGVFADFADTAVVARALFKLSRDPGFAACLVGGSHGSSCQDEPKTASTAGPGPRRR
jgi:glycerophosphoryl diester phosphodiesterase